MSKPYPIIYLSKVSDQERLTRALHRMGYRFPMFGDNERDDEDRMWANWSGGGAAERYPWVHIGRDWYMSASVSPGYSMTKVNSIPHFLSYTRALHAASAAQPHA